MKTPAYELTNTDNFFDLCETVLYGKDWEVVVGEKVVDQSRWTQTVEYIVKNKKTEKFYMFSFDQGLTEQQELDADDRYLEMVEVVPTEVTTVVYEVIE